MGALQQLEKTGSFITAEILDQKVFVVRGRDGELRAFYNVCQHRGHTLLEGRGQKPLIVCPFHAWTYRLDGALNQAPFSACVRDFDERSYSLTPIRVETLSFMVFVNLDNNAPPLAEVADGLLDQFREAIPDFDKQRLAREDELEVKANWKFILDGLECYHCPVIHPQTMVGPDAYVTKTFHTTLSPYHSQHITIGNYDLIDNHPEKLPWKLDPGITAIRDIFIWFLWPNLVFVARQGPSNFQILRAMPAAADHSRRTAINFCLNDPPTEFDYGHMNVYRDVVWPQDQTAMEQQQAGVRSRGYHQARLLVDPERATYWSEHATHHFDNLVWTSLNGSNYAKGLNDE